MNQPAESALKFARNVATRHDLLEYLDHGLVEEYRIRTSDDQIRQTTTFVKSYLVECHEDSVEIGNRQLGLFRTLTELEDPSLMRGETSDDQVYFLDRSIPRFMTMHTLERASDADQIFQKLTDGSVMGLDRCWLPSQFLDALDLGVMTGFGMRFSPSGPMLFGSHDDEIVDIETGEIIDEYFSPPGFRLSFSGGKSARAELNSLQRSDTFRGRRALNQIEVTIADLEDPGRRLTNVVYSHGKIVGHGIGVERHISTAMQILSHYGGILEAWEKNYSVEWSKVGNAFRYAGTPFLFFFPHVLSADQLSSMVEFIFSSAPPFRLFGIPLSTSEMRIDVDALDLHTGDRLRFEITNEYLRLFLPSGACANGIARFWRNFETTLAAETVVSVGDQNEPIRSLVRNADRFA